MPSPTICTITGTLTDVSGTAVSGATIQVSSIKPFIHTSDNSLVLNYSVSTTTAANGTFSINVIETTTVSTSMTFLIKYPLGANANQVTTSYTIIVPNSASATLASLISSQ